MKIKEIFFISNDCEYECDCDCESCGGHPPTIGFNYQKENKYDEYISFYIQDFTGEDVYFDNEDEDKEVIVKEILNNIFSNTINWSSENKKFIINELIKNDIEKFIEENWQKVEYIEKG